MLDLLLGCGELVKYWVNVFCLIWSWPYGRPKTQIHGKLVKTLPLGQAPRDGKAILWPECECCQFVQWPVCTKSSNCILFPDVYSLSLLVYRDLQPSLVNISLCVVPNTSTDVPSSLLQALYQSTHSLPDHSIFVHVSNFLFSLHCLITSSWVSRLKLSSPRPCMCFSHQISRRLTCRHWWSPSVPTQWPHHPHPVRVSRYGWL